MLTAPLERWMNISKYLSKMVQASIWVVVIPRRNFNSIVFVVHIVFSQIVHNDRSWKVSIEQVEVFDVDFSFRHCMVSIESVRDEIWGIYLVQNPVCIRLCTCSKDNDFVHISHFAYKAERIWADCVVSSVKVFMGVKMLKIFDLWRTEICKVNQCFIKVKH